MEKHILEVTAAIENMDLVMDFIEEQTQPIDNPKIAQQLTLAAEELALNVFNYAYDGVQGKLFLGIVIDTECRRVVMEFRDVGKPYNPLSRQNPDLNIPLSERKMGGLGILIFKRLTDEQSYAREDGQNILTLVKKY